MFPWWKFGVRARSIPQEQQRKGGLNPSVGYAPSDPDNADDAQVDRKRKAQQSLEQDNPSHRECSCCRPASASNVVHEVETPAKRMCSDSSDTSTTATTSRHVVTPQQSETIEPQQQQRQGLPSENEIQDLLWKEANFDPLAPNVTLKRSDYVVWDDFFMGMAKLSAMRSKDPQAPFSGGACIVDEENRVIGIGYNGFPRDCSDDDLPWWRADDDDDDDKIGNGNTKSPRQWLHTQSPYVCHAEVNAILNKCSANVEGARLYVARFPCHDCAKVIIQSRIKEVVYMDDTERDSDSSRASRIMFTMAGVMMRQYQPLQTSILLDFASVMAPSNDNNKEKEPALARSLQPILDANVASQFRELIVKEAGYDPVNTPSGKRTTGVLSWDDWFMAVAFLTAKRSKDPNTQVGACIVDGNKRIVGLGYNGFPRGCSDDYLPWARTAPSSSPLHTKYLYVCHAEVNAILNKGSSDVKGASIYVALFPCNDCAKVIIQAGIREVAYLNDQYHETDSCRASRIMFAMAGVQLRQHIPSIRNLTIQLDEEQP